MSRLSQYAAATVLTLLVAGVTIGALVGYVTFQTRLSRRELKIVYPIVSCDSLTQVNLTDIGGEGSIITEANETTHNNYSVCSVKGRLAPEINFQVFLPLKTWRQRYLQVGCSGLCGFIAVVSGVSDGCQALSDGTFAMSATDMGHHVADEAWGEDPQKIVDFAYRAQHVSGQAARKLIKIFYGQSETYSYFNGCSDGGREALMQAERYPGTFDGIIAGAPALLFQIQNTLYHGWQARSNTDANNKAILLNAKLPMLHQAVLNECDILDGVKDNLISNPAACKFVPQSIQCSESETNTTQCLTAEEVEVVRKFYTGPQDPQTGAYLTPGQPLYGSESQWRGAYVAASADQPLFSTFIALPVLRYLAFTKVDPNYTLSELQFTQQTFDTLRPRHPLYDTTNTGLRAFASTGRKLILWHGLADPQMPPAGTVSFYNTLVRDLGHDLVNYFLRLYLVPGMAHCTGGDGLNSLDLLSAIVAWVEEGKAPNAILTSNAGAPSPFGAPDLGGDGPKKPEGNGPPGMGPPEGNGPPGMGPPEGNGPPGMGPPKGNLDASSTRPNITRPIYPYPFTSQYIGHGDTYDAANWKQGPPAEYVSTRDWYGADLLGRYEFINQ